MPFPDSAVPGQAMNPLPAGPKPGFLERLIAGTGATLVARIPGLAAASSHIPPSQFGRYVVVGAWNTAFAYGMFAGLTALLTPKVPHAYILAGLLSSLANITVAFLGYKWFVFRTRGNYLKEWLRCFMVYSSNIVVSLVLLPFVVAAVRGVTGNARLAPYLAGALMTFFGVFYSFFGHKKFSFRTEAPASATGSIRPAR